MTAAAILLSLFMTSANAIATFGSYDCGQWFTKHILARPWLLGYLSGLAEGDYEIGKVDVLDRLNSADQAFLWMDNYCKSNPLKEVGEGAIDLYLELERQK